MKALVIGGSNGLGLAIAKKLIEAGFFVEIIGRSAPQAGALREDSYRLHRSDLLNLDQELISSFAADPELSVLMITAGFGRIADFAYFHPVEIEKMMTVNATATIQILRLFYDRIQGKERFYCGVVGSIAGLMSSPSAAVYAASKAAVCRLIESVNIELEVSGTENRILNVSPASFKGSRFYGGQTQLELLEGLAAEVTTHLFAADTLFIPQYEETFRAVLERYHADPHEYGLHSYQYKKESGRLDNRIRVAIGYLPGSFDRFGPAELAAIRSAKKRCDCLVVGLRGEGALSLPERRELLAACRYVDRVVESSGDLSEDWERLHFDKLFTDTGETDAEPLRERGVEIMPLVES